MQDKIEETQEFLDKHLLSFDSFSDETQEIVKRIAEAQVAVCDLPYEISLNLVLIDISKRVMKLRK